MVSGVHTDADDMCVSAVNAARHAVSGTPAIQQDTWADGVATAGGMHVNASLCGRHCG